MVSWLLSFPNVTFSKCTVWPRNALCCLVWQTASYPVHPSCTNSSAWRLLFHPLSACIMSELPVHQGLWQIFHQTSCLLFSPFSVMAKQLCYKLMLSTSEGRRGNQLLFHISCIPGLVKPKNIYSTVRSCQQEKWVGDNKIWNRQAVIIKLFLKHAGRKELITIKCDLAVWHNLLVISSKIPIIGALSFHIQQLIKFISIFIINNLSILHPTEEEHRENKK